MASVVCSLSLGGAGDLATPYFLIQGNWDRGAFLKNKVKMMSKPSEMSWRCTAALWTEAEQQLSVLRLARPMISLWGGSTPAVLPTFNNLSLCLPRPDCGGVKETPASQSSPKGCVQLLGWYFPMVPFCVTFPARL